MPPNDNTQKQIQKLNPLIYIEQKTIESTKILLMPPKCDIFPILRQQYWSFLYCSPFSYRSSNFAIAKVVALNLFALFLQIDLWLVCCIASHIVITLLNTERAIVVALLRYQNRQRKVTEIFSLLPLRARRKSDNLRERNQAKKQRADTKN